MEGGRRLVSVLSSDRLLTTGKAAQLPEKANSEMIVPNEARADEQILLFRLGADEFGIPVSAVREVTLRPKRLTSLPRAPAFVDGVMNLRGQVVPVIDQRRRFGIPHADAARKPVLVVALGASLAGFVVDAVTRVASVDAQALQPAPDLGLGNASVIDRVATLDIGGRLVLLVDPQELLDRAERDLLAAMESGAEAPQKP
jgi:purine-binding chemotaxis protein CheW